MYTMKRVLLLKGMCLGLGVFLFAAVSCNKVSAPEEEHAEALSFSEEEIVFKAGDFEMMTKAGTVGSTQAVIDYSGLPSINVSCTTGASAETAVWTNVPFTLSGGYYTGGKYWPVSNAGYNYWAANAPLTFASSGAKVTATNTTDVIVAHLPKDEVHYKLPNELVFEHVFARVGQVTVSAEDGYTISNVQITFVPKVSGTYDIKAGNGHTDATGWSATANGSTTKLADAVGVNANDVYTVPGEYTVTARWDAVPVSSPSTVLHYSGKTTVLNFVKGKINKFTAVLGGEMVFSYELAAWGTASQSVAVSDDMLTFDILTSGNILWKASNASIAKTIEYSKNNGGSWTSITSTTSGAAIAVSAGDKLMFRGSNAAYADASNYNCFAVSGGATFKAYGDVTSILSIENRATLSAYALKGLFQGCTALRNHEYMKLKLSSCTLAEGSYQNLFNGCTGLTVAPELKATAVAASCYAGMFQGCTSLVYPPDLVATTLAANCYSGMFQGCTSLTASPELPAATLVTGCYQNLFNGCTSLRHIKALFTTTPTAALCGDWTKNVAASGSFFKSTAATWNVVNSGSNYYGIPSGWTVKTVSE